MLDSLNSAVSGLQNFQSKMDVIGNNIANVGTTGFKSARTDFEEAFSQTLQQSGTTTDSGSLQVGSGVSTAAVRNVFSQGSLARTGVQDDLAVSGEGFFVVRDTGTNAQFATRAGDFHRDVNGFLITNTGQRVQGFSDAGLTTLGDIKIDTAGKPATAAANAAISSYFIDGDGKINVQLTDGTQFVRGQILLQSFGNPQALTKEGNNLFSGMAAAGALGGSTPAPAAPGSNGLGVIKSGQLELSNVDLAGEFADMITTQRGFQANARVISASDELMQTIVNLVH